MGRLMSEREFRGWQQYAARRMLPTRRIELYLAQIALVVSRTMGNGADLTMNDFLFDLEPEDLDQTETAREAFAFAPRNRKD